MGRGSQQPGRTGNLFYVKIVTKKGQEPHFELIEAGDKEKKVTTETKLSGMLVDAAHRTFVSKETKSDMDSISLTLFDSTAGEKGETYKIETLLSGASRDIINKLLSVDEFFTRDIEIRIWQNDKGYPSTWVGWKGEQKGFNWTYDLDYTKTMISKVVKKEKKDGKIVDSTINDYLELNEFFIKELKDKVIPKLKGSKNPVTKGQEGTEDHIPDGPPEDTSGDDLPF